MNQGIFLTVKKNKPWSKVITESDDHGKKMESTALSIQVEIYPKMLSSLTKRK